MYVSSSLSAVLRSLGVAAAVSGLPTPSAAQEGAHDRESQAPTAHASAPHDWRDGPHHLSVLIAGTDDSEETAPTLGLDYEYRVSDFLGLGAVAEYAFEDISSTTLLAAADLHLTHQFVIQTGPGVEFIEGEEEFVYRIGVLYEWERGGYTISPQLHYDMTSGEDSVVFGVALGICQVGS